MTCPRRGFTMIELLLASVLMAVLMIGVLAVITRLAPVDEPALTADQPSSEVDALIRLLRDDLLHAQHVETLSEREILLISHGSMESNTRRYVHRPVTVRYQITTVDGEPWLIRRQTALDVLTNQNEQRDLVYRGINRIALASSVATQSAKVDVAAVEQLEQTVQAVTPEQATEDESDQVASASGSNYRVTEDNQILYNGLVFYRGVLPDWVLDHAKDSVTDDEVTGESSPKNQIAGGAGPTRLTAPLRTKIIRSSRMTWRVQAWNAQSPQPVVDRLIPMGKGASS